MATKASAFQRLREKTNGGFVIHADMPSGDDRTLCGYAVEGSCLLGEGDSGVVPVDRGRINCVDCLQIIWHCQDNIRANNCAPLDPAKLRRGTDPQERREDVMDLIIRPSGIASHPWSLQLRSHESLGETAYVTLWRGSEDQARDIIEAGAAEWLFGDPSARRPTSQRTAEEK